MVDGVNESVSVSLVTGRLYKSRLVRQSLARVMKPLEREGVDYFACVRDGETEVIVTAEDLGAFNDAVGGADVVSDVVTENVLLQIESAVFKQDHKWRFSDGGTSFFAEIADVDFLARINSGEERFGKGDVLVVDLRRTQSVTDNGLKMDHIVDRVTQHRAPIQAGLFPRV